MPAYEMEQALYDSAAEVLETMFFTSAVGDAEPEGLTTREWVSARLSFRGGARGRFGVRVPTETGRNLAANFLGVEEEAVSVAQVGEVVCELANMLCGSVLSRLKEGSRFEINAPELDPSETEPGGEGQPALRQLALTEGTVTLWLELEPPR